ncbi:uncharacterized protein N7483_010979 [Penicillium malachiteum]|uniref:uncharacterized protein n=1 Tax=Penicillium malachiteum TaxID=1324776 RepID=UPI002546E2FF|nr:uncharacterized protein N7483_010979 [Penicillium malachiteum]KAJ5713798.1 hypothetical protein N7483_010979 [Penicillium malachiteum]
MMGHAAGWSATNNSHNHREIVITLGAVLSSLGSILMILRFYTYFYIIRHRGGQALVWATLSWILAALSTAFYCVFPYHPHLTISKVLATTADLLAYWAMAFMKLAMTMYILHIQEGIYKLGKWILLAASGLNRTNKMTIHRGDIDSNGYRTDFHGCIEMPSRDAEDSNVRKERNIWIDLGSR